MQLRSGTQFYLTMSSHDDITAVISSASVTTTTSVTVTTMAPTFTTSTSTTATTTTTASAMFHSPVLAPTFKLLHHDPSIQKFGGEDISHYSPLQFLQQCEDSIRNSNITAGVDKISFVRSQLLPGSIAADLMSASAFNPKSLNYDYQAFRSNFLQAFGMPQQPDSFQWIFDGAESLTSNFGSLNCLRALPRPAELASAAVESLRASNWITNGTLSEQKFQDIIEFLYYINFLNPSERRVASTLTYSPNDNLLNFSTKIASKLKQHPAQVHVVASPSIASPQSAAQISPSSTPIPDQQRAVYSCTYCHKQGHTYSRCFQRQRRERNAARSPSAPRFSRQDSQHDNGNFSGSMPHRPRSSSRSGRSASHIVSQRPTKTCLVHGPGNHSSEECYKIQRLQRQQQVTVSSPQSSFYQRHQSPPTA